MVPARMLSLLAPLAVVSLLLSLSLPAAQGQPSPPDIGNEFVTNITMNRPLRSGVMYGSELYTLFVQSSPLIDFPNQLNLCNHGQQETYVAYNPAKSTCNGASDPLYCRDGLTCNKTDCIALFDNPFMGLPFTELKGTCQPSGADLWMVQNGGYTLTYCITRRNEPLSLVIEGAGGRLEYNFTNYKEQRVPARTFAVPPYCTCSGIAAIPGGREATLERLAATYARRLRFD